MSNKISINMILNDNGISKRLRGLGNEMGILGGKTNMSKKEMSGFQAQTKKMNQSLQNLSKDANRASNEMSNMGKAFGKMKGLLGVGVLYMLAQGFSKAIQSAVAMTETANLFNVALGMMAEQTQATVLELNKVYGFDPTNLQNSIGTFALLARSMGMTNENASNLGVNTTKLANDLASLTNVPIAQVMQDLRSGLVGQSETVYKYGIDVTEAGLKTEALRQGISKSVRNMSQGEKMALRYATMIRQTSLAQGDFARTINSPANQLKILSEKFITLTRTMGTIFMPAIGAILPYLNAVVTQLIMISRLVALAFGYKAWEIKNTNNSIGKVGDDADASAGSVDKLSKKVKELTSGMDELNVISPPTDSSSAGGGGVSAGTPIDISPEYNDMMNKIKNTSEEIRKSINSWFSNIGDWDNVGIKFNNILLALTPIKTILFTGLSYFYDKILQPLGTWVVNQALPTFLTTLSSVFRVISSTLEALSPTFKWFIDNVLIPLGSWTGGIIIDTLNILTTTLNTIGSWIQDNKIFVNEMTDAVLLFFGAWKGIELMSFIAQAGGVVKALTSISIAIKAVTTAKLADAWATIYLTALYAGDFLASIISGIEQLIRQVFVWGTLTSAKIADKIETLAFMALYAKDFVVAMVSSTAQLAKQIILWGILTSSKIADKIATIASTVAINFMSIAQTALNLVMSLNPIALLVAGIIALGLAFKYAWDHSEAFRNIMTELAKGFVGIGNIIITAWEKVLNFIVNGINSLLPYINILADGINKVASKLGFSVSFGIKPFAPIKLPRIPALAQGGMLESGQLFQAGEFGKAEALGTHNGKTTVMPLENTDFVQAIYEAVKSAMSSSENNTVIENVLHLDGDVVYRNQQKIAKTRGLDFDMGVFAR